MDVRRLPRVWRLGVLPEIDTDVCTARVRVLVDGVEVDGVTAYDLDAGAVDVVCKDGEGAHAGGLHVDPDRPDRVCVRTIHSTVTMEAKYED
jgi:hypothetical protein